jgi:hypothetical protein
MATKTDKAVENAQNIAEATQNSLASPATGGRTTDDDGVDAIVNPELGNSQSVAFPTGDGEADVYSNGPVHRVPAAYLDVKNAEGVAYLVAPKKEAE